MLNQRRATELTCISLDLHVGRTCIRLGMIVGFFAVMNMAGPVSTHVLGHPSVFGLVPLSRKLFALHGESNIPTWFSGWLLLANGVAAFIVSRSPAELIEGHARRGWSLAAAVFVYLSIDEMVMLHEFFDELAVPLLSKERLEVVRWLWPGQTPRIPWVAIGVPLAAILILLLLPWIAGLPRRTLRLFAMSGILYIGGAAGVEFATWKLFSDLSPEGLRRAGMITLEESMEMLGAITALYATLDFARAGALSLLITPR